MTDYSFAITSEGSKYTVTCRATDGQVTSIDVTGPDGPIDLADEEAFALLTASPTRRLIRFLIELNALAHEGLLSDGSDTETTLRQVNRIRNLYDAIDPDEDVSPVFLALAAVDSREAQTAAIGHRNWPRPDNYPGADPVQVARARTASPELLRRIADNETVLGNRGNPAVWANLLHNPNTPDDVLERAADFAAGRTGTTHGRARAAVETSTVYAERGSNPERLWLIAVAARTSAVWFNPRFPITAAMATARTTNLTEDDPFHRRPLALLHKAIAERPDCPPEIAEQIQFVAKVVLPGQQQLY